MRIPQYLVVIFQVVWQTRGAGEFSYYANYDDYVNDDPLFYNISHFNDPSFDPPTLPPEKRKLYMAETLTTARVSPPGEALLNKITTYGKDIEILFGSSERAETLLIDPILSVDGIALRNNGDLVWAWEQARINVQDEMDAKREKFVATPIIINNEEVVLIIEEAIENLFILNNSAWEAFALLRRNRNHLDCSLSSPKVSSIFHGLTRSFFDESRNYSCINSVFESLHVLDDVDLTSNGCGEKTVYKQFVYDVEIINIVSEGRNLSAFDENSDNFDLKTDFISSVLNKDTFGIVTSEYCKANQHGNCTEDVLQKLAAILCGQYFTVPPVYSLLASLRWNSTLQQDEKIFHLFHIEKKLAEKSGFVFPTSVPTSITKISLNVSDLPVDNPNYAIWNSLGVFASFVSIILLTLALGILWRYWKETNKVRSHFAAMNLIVSLVFLQISKILVFTASRHDHMPVCQAVAIANVCTAITSMAWIVLEAIFLYRSIFKVISLRQNSLVVLIMMFGWLMPVIVSSILAQNLIKYGHLAESIGDLCKISIHAPEKWSVLAPLICTISVVIALMVKTSLEFRKCAIFFVNEDIFNRNTTDANDTESNAQIQPWLIEKEISLPRTSKRYIYGLYLILVYLTLTEVMALYIDMRTFTLILYIVSTISQGTVILVIYCLTDEKIRENLRNRICKRRRRT